MKKRDPEALVAVWTRVPYKYVQAVQRHHPRPGWRARLVREVMAELARRLEGGYGGDNESFEQVQYEAINVAIDTFDLDH